MQAIGIDIGYGYTKINTGARVESYPSIVGNFEENRISIGFERHLPEMIEIDGEKFEVSKDLVYSYVQAMIVTEIHTLQVYLGEDFVQSFEYRMPTEFSS